MYRFEFDAGDWPAVRITARDTRDTGSVEDAEGYIRNWEEWLSRGQRFAVLMVSRHEEQPRSNREARRLGNRWHKANRERVGRLCVGVAWVPESSRLTALFRPIVGLDLTGSGVETIAYLKADGRIILMFCAFSGLPKIAHLYERGQIHKPDDDAYGELRPRFPDQPGERTVVEVAVSRVSNSCGFGVPMMDLVGPRRSLADYAGRKGEAGMVSYRERFNARSIDGLPGLEPAGEGSRV